MTLISAKVSPLVLECTLLDVDAVTPGHDFTVRVRARTSTSPVLVRSIEFAWHGIERLDPAWVKVHSNDPTKTSGLSPGERYVARGSVGDSVGENAIVNPGDGISFTIGIRLPPGLPPTFRGQVGRITYFITCTAVSTAVTSDKNKDTPDTNEHLVWERTHVRVPLRVRVGNGAGFERRAAERNTNDAAQPNTSTNTNTNGTYVDTTSDWFWMHSLASSAMGALRVNGTSHTQNIETTKLPTSSPSSPSAASPHPLSPMGKHSASGSSSPSSLHRLGVKTSPRSDLGPKCGACSPGSPLAALNRNGSNEKGFGGKSSAISLNFSSRRSLDDGEIANGNESNPSTSNPSGFVIAMADDWSKDSKRSVGGQTTKKINLAKIFLADPFPSASPGEVIGGRIEFDYFGSDDVRSKPKDSAVDSVDSVGTSGEKTSGDVSLESSYATVYADTPRVVRVVISLETNEQVDRKGGQLDRDEGFDSTAHITSDASQTLIHRRKVWSEQALLTADVSNVSFALSAPFSSLTPPTFETHNIKLNWNLRFAFTVTTPDNVIIRSTRPVAHSITQNLEWCVPVVMASVRGGGGVASSEKNSEENENTPSPSLGREKENITGSASGTLGVESREPELEKNMPRDSSLLALS